MVFCHQLVEQKSVFSRLLDEQLLFYCNEAWVTFRDHVNNQNNIIVIIIIIITSGTRPRVAVALSGD
jgi:hypothetical protein